uniref:Uncharacterized protein n=1 Tax=Timema douglasi TaxID=61478 RepID=A0A7R8VBH1_TIMDO|nr:unnamed protein product [Timema douglasi]
MTTKRTYQIGNGARSGINLPAFYVASPTLNSGHGKVKRSGQYWQEALQFLIPRKVDQGRGDPVMGGWEIEGSSCLACVHSQTQLSIVTRSVVLSLSSQLYRSSSFNSSGRSSTCDTADDMYSDVSLEEDVLDLNHKRGGPKRDPAHRDNGVRVI